MRFLKFGIIFTIAFIISWIIIFTFVQKEFHVPVQPKIFFFPKAQAIPVYWYLIGAFGLGLGIGLVIAVYYAFVLSGKRGELKDRNRDLEQANESLKSEIERLNRDLDTVSAAAAQIQPPAGPPADPSFSG